jgi:mRNA interferase RelE/StbE
VTGKYQIRVDHRARKALGHLDPVIRSRIVKAITALGEDPEPAGCKALRTMVTVLRIRVGDYRVLYRIDHTARTVTVIDIGHRSDIYKQ